MSDVEPIKSVAFKTLGCKLNQSESDAIRDQFLRRGFEIRNFGESADLTVINTCTVTNDADAGSRYAIRQAVRGSPQGRIVVTGCYAQVNPQDLEKIEGVDLILGNDEKYRIFDYLDKISAGKLESPLTFVNDEGGFTSVTEEGFVSATSRHRAFLKVQEGCNYYCSFCIIPFSRGRARSRSIASSVEEARSLVERGFAEITLTGINIGTYAPSEDENLVQLLDQIQNVPGLKRLRLSSIEPNTVTEDLLKLIRDSEVICPHLHIPLQSASANILLAMNRKYARTDYERVLNWMNKYLPNAALGTDVITGFPTETEDDFNTTQKFLEQGPFTYLHIFRYSDREGTVASKMTNKVDSTEIKKRSQILHETSRMLKVRFARNFLSKVLSVNFDDYKNGEALGYTKHYLRVAVPGSEKLVGKILDVKMNDFQSGVMTGTLTTSSFFESKKSNTPVDNQGT